MLATLERILFPHANRLSTPAFACLALISFLLFSPGLFLLPPIDRDEARFAQASRQMAESNNWVDIRFQDEVRYKKPVGIYWLQAATVKAAQALGIENANSIIGIYRLPSLLGAILSILITGAIGARFFGARAGFVGAALFASCLLINVEARMAKTDAMLLACALTCIAVMAKAFMRRGLNIPIKGKDFLLFWIALGVGFLIKGPVILLPVLGLPIMMRIMGDKLFWTKPLRPLFGLPLALLIAAPWFVAILMQSGAEFLKESAGQDLLAKIWQGQNWGGAPPGYHTVLSWGVFWPLSLPLWLALPWIWANRRDPVLKFLIAWTVPVWVLFELIFTKLPHYVLLAYPALALAATAWLMRRDAASRPPRGYRAVVMLIWSVVAIGMCLVPAVMPVFVENQIFFFPIFFGGLALGLGLAAVQLLRRDQRRFAPIPLFFAGAILSFALFRFLFLDMPSVFISARIHENMAPPGNCVETKLAIAGYSEPSLVFLEGRNTQLMKSGEDVALALSADPCLTAAVTQDELPSLKETLERVGARVVEIASIKGFNYGRGKPTTVTIYQNQNAQ